MKPCRKSGGNLHVRGFNGVASSGSYATTSRVTMSFNAASAAAPGTRELSIGKCGCIIKLFPKGRNQSFLLCSHSLKPKESHPAVNHVKPIQITPHAGCK